MQRNRCEPIEAAKTAKAGLCLAGDEVVIAMEIVWNTIQQDLPMLIDAVRWRVNGIK